MNVRNARRRKGGLVTGGAVIMLTLLLTACAPVGTVTPTSPLPTPSPTPPPPTPTPTAAPGPLMVTLTLWMPEELSPYGEDPASVLLGQQVDDFNQAHTDLQVAIIVKKAHGRGGLLDFLRTASAAAVSQVIPDLVVMDADDAQVAAQEGLVQPLDGLLSDQLIIDLFPFTSALGQVDGQIMDVPLTAELDCLAYHPTLFARPPLSWTDVLSSPTPLAFAAGGREDGVNDGTLVQYLAAGGHLTDGEGNPRLEAEPLTAVLDFYARASEVGVISPTILLSLDNADGCWELLRDWQVGMAVVGCRRLLSEPGVATPGIIPTQDGRAVTLAQAQWVLVLVTADPQRQAQAMRLMDWLMSAERYGPWTQSLGNLPTTRSGMAAWTIPEEERAVLETLLEGAQPSPPAVLRETVGPPMQAALEAVLRGHRNPAAAATDAVHAVEPPP